MLAELLFFVIYIAQQLGVMLGVGAQTVLLCTHLLALHHHEQESPHDTFARAAHLALGAGLALIIVSGAGAVAMHAVGGNIEVLLAPAFLFKWVLIAVVGAAYLLQGRLKAWSNTVAYAAGGTWYALFMVHSLAPVATWATLGVLYAGWMMFFAALWFGFVLVMRGTHTPVAVAGQKSSGLSRLQPSPQRPAGQTFAQQPQPTPVIKPAVVVAPPPPKPVVVAPPPKPLPPPPMIIPPVPLPVVVAKPVPPPPPPKPIAPIVKAAETLVHKIEETWLPALRIMPQKAEDLSKYERGPVVQSEKD